MKRYFGIIVAVVGVCAGIVWTMRELRGELFEQCFLIHTARPP